MSYESREVTDQELEAVVGGGGGALVGLGLGLVARLVLFLLRR
jgi:hypothetical protein